MLKREKSTGRPVVGHASGAFDLFHIGHLNILSQAKRHCDYLIVGVASDEVLEMAKGRGPLIPENERAEIVRHIDYVDQVHIDYAPDTLDTWRQLQFDIVFKGDDWRNTPRGILREKMFAEVGVQVMYFPYTLHTSSTTLRAALDILNGAADNRKQTTRR
ncbi:cytidyltransferase [Kocuria sp. UCD-OTCP]|nr:cytidyltransferase [Kocuria sp. UCD-OTCP]